MSIPFNFLSDCSESSLKSFNLNCLNQIQMLEKAIAEAMGDLAMWRGRLEATQEFIAHREEIIEALRAQAMKDALTIEPQRAERITPARKVEAA